MITLLYICCFCCCKYLGAHFTGKFVVVDVWMVILVPTLLLVIVILMAAGLSVKCKEKVTHLVSNKLEVSRSLWESVKKNFPSVPREILCDFNSIATAGQADT